ncbi:cytochrome P450 [Nocardiopsis gilva YIM 90087]|uniref:Cytochrome P450 n=1 Tax=Nocardiopsis gilva YIM 90087 TaxID=1235441 RepID=A0A223S7D2_9ACTN|nr:cytochrome P450 [Nocardiopsis gilva]ASU84027.1 cytochrome P450 [Nocardiopsis gilva YIM 90087]
MTSTSLADRWGIQPQHAWLRGQQPEATVEYDEKQRHWNVFGYPETVDILADPATFASDVTRLYPDSIPESLKDGDLTLMDGADHRKLRKLTVHAFTPRTVADLEPRITEICGELLDKVAEQERIELVNDLAYSLPVIVIAELLGVPSSDRDMFREWADEMLAAQMEWFDKKDQPQGEQMPLDFTAPISDYFREHANERRKRPRQDLLTRLVEAEVDGERLTDDQVTTFAGLLLTAGHITTTMLLGNTVVCLDAHPEQQARVRADRSMVPTAIEEALRFLSPVAHAIRATTTDVEVAGQRIPADQLVIAWMSAANRDPRQFDRPHAFDVTRDPNPHLGFGRGVHFCLGAPLARLESRIALNALLDRFPALHTDPGDPPVFMEHMSFTGVRRLPLRIR